MNEAHSGGTVNDSIVTLSGHVPADAENQGAEKATKRYGVKANELDFSSPAAANAPTRTSRKLAGDFSVGK